MAMSSCKESDGKEESAPDCNCSTITCVYGSLQNPSLNPPPPLGTQPHLRPEEEEEESSLGPAAGASSSSSSSSPESEGDGSALHVHDHAAAPHVVFDDDAVNDADAIIRPPSRHLPIHPHDHAFSHTQADVPLSAERELHSPECNSCPDMTPSTTPSPSPSSPSSSNLRHQLPSSATLDPATHIHPPEERVKPRHSQWQPRDPSAATLDPNAREFVPIPSALISLPSQFQQSQTPSLQSFVFPHSEMAASLHHQMGSLNVEMGSSNAAAYESVQPHHEMSAAFYNVHPTPSEMGYHTSSVAEVSYNQEIVAHENASYGVYQATPQIGYPSPQGGLLTPPWHNVGLPPLPAVAVVSSPFVGAVPMAPTPPAPSPSMYPSTASMEAHRVSMQKQFHAHHGCGNPKEHVSRTLLITGIPTHVSEAQLREELGWWGAIRGIQADAQPQGLQVMVQFFDLRSAKQALRDMQNIYLAHQHQYQQFHSTDINPTENFHSDEGLARGIGRMGVLCGSVVSAQYIGSWGMAVPDAHNQGTLVLFNVGADVNMQAVRQIFEAYGHVREVREAPAKRQHKFVEFYDIRAAATAWSALNGKEICGKCVKIEFSRQGGAAARRQKTHQDKAQQEMIAACVNRSSMQGHGTMDPCSWQGSAATYGLSLYTAGSQMHGWDRWSSSHEGVSGQYPVNVCMSGGSHGVPIPIYPEAVAGPLADGNGIIGENVGVASGARRVHSEPGRVVTCHSHGVGKDRYAGVSRLVKGLTHFQFDEDEMYTHQNNPRTTLMIQNIPNKYSQKMLLTMLDQHCSEFNNNLNGSEPEAAYDFMYLPIDFKNKCNLGYAFVNFTTPQATLGFYKVFHGKAWEEFNSRKICGVAFARLQGRLALEEHFKNSRFACDTEEYLPVLFVPPRNGNNESQPRVAVGQQGLVRGVRSENGGQSYFSNDPCNQQDKVVFDTSSCGGGSSSGSNSISISISNSNSNSNSNSSSTNTCKAHDHREALEVTHASDPQGSEIVCASAAQESLASGYGVAIN